MQILEQSIFICLEHLQDIERGECMIGTLFNCSTIVAGSFIGSRLKRGIKAEYEDILLQALGLAAAAVGVNSVVQSMPKSQYPVLFIISLAIGALLGEWIRLEERFKIIISRCFRRKLSAQDSLAQGLSTALLLFCVGSLSILGPMQSALYGDNTYLFTNGMLDFVTSMVLSSSYGFGIAAAAIVLFVWQSFFYCLALLLSGALDPVLLTELSIIGGILIFSSGLSIMGLGKFKTMNMIPALLIPPLFFCLVSVWKQISG